MESLENQLQQLALEAQEHFGTLKGQQVLMRLWDLAYRSGKFYRPPREALPGNYEDVYSDALYHLMEYTLKNITKYDPKQASVIGWMNMKLERRFLKEAIERTRRHSDKFIAAPHPAEMENAIEDRAFNIENQPAPERKESLTSVEALRTYFMEDCDNQFRSVSMRKYPSITFQTVVVRRLDGYSFTEIANEFQIPYTALVSFFQRQLKQLLPVIKSSPIVQEYCEDL